MPGTAAPGRAVGPAGPHAVLAMLLFLGAEAMYLAGLVSAFLVLRASAGAWPPPNQPSLPIAGAAVSTAVLLASGYTMVRARRALRAARPAALARGLALTAALGAAFLALQSTEWLRLLAQGLRPGSGAYGGVVAVTVGSHALHVAGGVVALLMAWTGARRRDGMPGRYAPVTALQLYWLFAVGVWPPLCALVYFWGSP